MDARTYIMNSLQIATISSPLANNVGVPPIVA